MPLINYERDDCDYKNYNSGQCVKNWSKIYEGIIKHKSKWNKYFWNQSKEYK